MREVRIQVHEHFLDQLHNKGCLLPEKKPGMNFQG